MISLLVAGVFAISVDQYVVVSYSEPVRVNSSY